MSVQAVQPRMVAMPLAPMVMEPLTLEGQYVRLEPLSMEHHAGLCAALLHDEIWRWLPWRIDTPDEMRAFMQQVINMSAEGSAYAFATLYKPDNRVVGTSRYLSIDHANHRLEIGATLISPEWQRSVINTEAKYLMLRHAFETLGCLRMEFKTDSLNTKSRNALLRLGATEEGIFRNHIVCWNGRIRHSAYYSITDDDWPSVKANLEAKLVRPFTPNA